MRPAGRGECPGAPVKVAAFRTPPSRSLVGHHPAQASSQFPCIRHGGVWSANHWALLRRNTPVLPRDRPQIPFCIKPPVFGVGGGLNRAQLSNAAYGPLFGSGGLLPCAECTGRD